MNVIGISGSLRKDSFNTKLVRAMQELAPAGMHITIADIAGFPLFSEDIEKDFPPVVRKLKDAIAAADGVVIATPEYNRSIPGPLKNAVDWLTRPYGDNSFAGKPMLVAGVSVGKIGTAIAQSHLKHTLVYLDAKVVGQPELYLGPASELFDAAGALTHEPTKALVAKALAALAARA